MSTTQNKHQTDDESAKLNNEIEKQKEIANKYKEFYIKCNIVNKNQGIYIATTDELAKDNKYILRRSEVSEAS